MGTERMYRLTTRAPARLPGSTPDSFVAIDFETADNGRDSACAVALVRVEGDRIVARDSSLIRPPRRRFLFTHIHGLTWERVASEPTFAEVWPRLARLIDGAPVLAAHNAGFDRSVLQACCAAAGIDPPSQQFVCTLQLSRRTWTLPGYRLSDVAEHLSIPLQHHDAASDAEACARILLAARMRARAAGGE